MWPRYGTALSLSLVGLLLLLQAQALVHQQVAFDSADVCWWGLVPPDPVCPVLSHQNLTELVNSLAGRYHWDATPQCEAGFCLYANRGFAGGRGIALITTQESYLRVKAVGDLLQEHDISFKDQTSDSALPFHVGSVDGKGEGLLVDQPLRRGDPIMAHTPVLLVHRAFREDLPPPRQQLLLEAAINLLPKPTADLFLNLSGHAHASQDHRVAAILHTNGFQVDLDLGPDADQGRGHHYAVFPEVARMNHDCRPNVVFYVDPATLMHITTAVREIHPGEELTLSYLDPFAPHHERQERARAVWGFGCECELCRAPEEDAADSEMRLAEIQWIESRLEDSTSTEVSTGLISYLMGLYENEGLYCCLAGAYALAALNFNMLGFASQAVTYAGLAIEALKMEQGETAPDIRSLTELSRDPKGHFTWKGRVKKPAEKAPPSATTLASAEAFITS